MDEDLDSVLTRFFQRQPQVVSAYLFGSQATGRAGPLSDIDVAVILTEEAQRGDDVHEREALLHVELMKALRTDKVDLVFLHEAGPFLAHRVIRDGRRVYVRDELLDQRFRVHVVQQYLDTAPLRRLQAEELRKRIAQGRFGQGRRGIWSIVR